MCFKRKAFKQVANVPGMAAPSTVNHKVKRLIKYRKFSFARSVLLVRDLAKYQSSVQSVWKSQSLEGWLVVPPDPVLFNGIRYYFSLTS